MIAATASTGNQDTPVWRPALWLRTLAAKSPKKWSRARSIRVVLAVTGPALIGFFSHKMDITIWASIAALILTISEADVFYKARLHQIALSLPIVSASLLLGFLAQTPTFVVVAVMTLISFMLGIVSGYSHLLSITSMQILWMSTLLIGSTTAAPYWPAALSFFAGGIFYAFLLGIEALIYRNQPDRVELEKLLRALAELAAAQARVANNGPADADTDTVIDITSFDEKAEAALNQFDAVELAKRSFAQGSTKAYQMAARISRAADEVLAKLLTHELAAADAKKIADRLQEYADAVVNHKTPDATNKVSGFARLQMLENAIWQGSSDLEAETKQEKRKLHVKAPGRDLILIAARFAFCMMVGYLVFELTSLKHGYWVPLTIAIVMKPDMGSVFARVVSRVTGTVAGAVIVTLAALIITEQVWLIAVIAVFAFIVPWAMAVNYATQMVFFTPIIMILLKLGDASDKIASLGLDRVVATLIGGLIVIVLGYAIWPLSRHPNIAVKFSACLTVLARYADSISKHKEATQIANDRLAVYRSLSNVAVAIQQTLAEPPPAGVEAVSWLPLVSDLDRITDRITDMSVSAKNADSQSNAVVLERLADLIAQMNTRNTETDLQEIAEQISASTETVSDPAVRELADDVKHLEKMLLKSHSALQHRFKIVT